MKEIYQAVASRLGTVGGLRYVGPDCGQIDAAGSLPADGFPCALVGVSYPVCEDLDTRVQRCDAEVTVRLAFRSWTNPSPTDWESELVGQTELLDAVHRSLQGWGGGSFGSLSRSAFEPERRADGIACWRTVFAASFEDDPDAQDTGVSGPLGLLGATIGFGASATASRSVAVALELDGIPTHYRMAEQDDFAAARWKPYASSIVRFTLSDGDGPKTVFAQVRNDASMSDTVSCGIRLEQSETPGPVVLDSISIDGGAAATASREVTVSFSVSGTPTHYRLGENGDLSGEWTAYADPAAYTLSDGDGPKTVFAQVKDASGQSAVRSASITLSRTEAPAGARAVLSLGWNWSAGGFGTNYDAATGICKVRPGSEVSAYAIYDTGGNAIGSFTTDGMSATGSANLGNVTGDDSGAYPDLALRFSMGKIMELETGSISMNLPAGRYRVKLLVNTKNNKSNAKCVYAVGSGDDFLQLPLPASFYDNFNRTMDATVDVADRPLVVRLSVNEGTGGLIFLNVIDIERI